MNTCNVLKILILFTAFWVTDMVNAKVKLPALVSDGMVLQRDQNIKIWGKADVGEKVNITFQNKKYSITANAAGNWNLMLPAMKAGGPFTMTVNEITLENIMIGEVWLASGQSNMELPMRRVKPLYQEEIQNANNKDIRFFTVPQKYNFKSTQEDLDGGVWETTNQQTILNFSAVAYFFAKVIHEKMNVPVGIINASLGGSPVQAWMGENSLKKYPEYLSEAKKWQNDQLIQTTESSEQVLSKAWYSELDKNDKGVSEHWEQSLGNDSGWSTMNIPGSWEDKEGAFEGSVWFRKEITLPKGAGTTAAFLNLGRIKDADITYINGIKAGNVTYEYPPRWYDIPAGVLKEGKNIITVRVLNGSGKGEFIKDKPYELQIGDQKIDLKGEWKCKIGYKMNRNAPGQTFIRWKPTGLYNAMIHPLTGYALKGVIWYQGESNSGKPDEYKDLLSTMISDWRSQWNQKDLPFLIVQLANFMEAKSQPIESNWAQLREQQRNVSLTVPNTGLAVAIDAGEWNDIHPLHKKTIGDRLALQALKIAYKENMVADGPVYESFKKEKNTIILSFKKGTDDFSPVSSLKGFAIKNENGNFVWANAEIKGNKIVVWSDAVQNPAAVRYAWADNPDQANLKNRNGLPASPFTTE